ncbi:MAG: hypothetical protein LIO46_01020 [Clostridiales bacterium]|nr:hypothetical protein [Clostridiales bacterium]
MAYISQTEYDRLSGEAKREYDLQIEKHGRITNMKKTLLHSVPSFRVLMEWYPLRDEVAGFIGDRGVNFFCYAISTQNDCLICSMFFKKILDDLDIDIRSFQFTQEEQDLVDYGQGLVRDPAHIPPELFDRLKARYTEEQLVALTAFGSMMIATNLINTALHVELDDYLVPYTEK